MNTKTFTARKNLEINRVVECPSGTYIVIDDGQFVMAYDAADYRRIQDDEFGDYNDWCQAIDAVADEDVAREILAHAGAPHLRRLALGAGCCTEVEYSA